MRKWIEMSMGHFLFFSNFDVCYRDIFYKITNQLLKLQMHSKENDLISANYISPVSYTAFLIVYRINYTKICNVRVAIKMSSSPKEKERNKE